jgi:tetratricopeptide (TPR) repeat protein
MTRLRRVSIVPRVYLLLGQCRIFQGDWEEAVRVSEEALAAYPDDPDLLFQAGNLNTDLGRWAPARLALERLVDGEEGERGGTVDTGLRTYRGRTNLALLYRRMGALEHCERELRAIAEEYPDYLVAALALAETLEMMGRTEEARALRDASPGAEA